MKRAFVLLAVLVLAGGTVWGQEPPVSHYENLKCYEQLVGQWLYEGTIGEDIPTMAAKGDALSLRLNYRWILDKNAVESNLVVHINGEPSSQGKHLIFWDPVDEQIMQGGLTSRGVRTVATVHYDDAAKKWTVKSSGVDSRGQSLSRTLVLTLKDKNTLAAQILNRQGGLVQGDSPTYTYTRVQRAKKAKKAQT
jgi:hypothetical protein